MKNPEQGKSPDTDEVNPIAELEKIAGRTPAGENQEPEIAPDDNSGEVKADTLPAEQPAGTEVKEEPAEQGEKPEAESAVNDEPLEQVELKVPEPPIRQKIENEQPKIEQPISAGVETENPQASTEESKMLKEVELIKTFKTVIDGIRYGQGSIFEVLNNKNGPINVSLGKASGLYASLTGGRNLDKDAKEKARQDAVVSGKKVMKKNEWNNPENLAKFTKSVEKKNYGAAVRVGWDKLDESGKQQYHGDIKEYIHALEAQRKNMADAGAYLSRDVYYDLMGRGYKAESFKVRKSFFGKRAISVGMVGPDGKPDNKKINTLVESETNLSAQKQQQVKEAMDKMYNVAVVNWKKRKIKAAGHLVVNQLSPEGFTKGLELNASDSSVLSHMTREEAAKETLTPKIIAPEKEIDEANRTAASRTESLVYVAKRAGEVYKLTPEEVAGLNNYAQSDEGQLPKLPKKLSLLLESFVAKRKKISRTKMEKIKLAEEVLLKGLLEQIDVI